MESLIEMRRKAPVMEGHLEETLAVSWPGATRSRGWMHQVITLLEAAAGQLHNKEHPAQGTLLEAATLLRQQVQPPVAQPVSDVRGRLLAWQARKVRDHIDSHITGPVLVADLCALVQRSAAHFSRSFKRTFGESPHSFVVRRRVELATQYMLTTDAPLSDIALRCGFTDQAHLCKHFRQATGQTPSAWRRAHASRQEEKGTPPRERFATASHNGTQDPAGRAAAIRVLRPAPQLAREQTGLRQSRAFSPEPLLRTGS
jgi:AraC family transcriptional regulator